MADSLTETGKLTITYLKGDFYYREVISDIELSGIMQTQLPNVLTACYRKARAEVERKFKAMQKEEKRGKLPG